MHKICRYRWRDVVCERGKICIKKSLNWKITSKPLPSYIGHEEHIDEIEGFLYDDEEWDTLQE